MISTWTVAIFLIFSNDQAAVTADTHPKAHIGMMETKEGVFDEQSESEWVYATKDDMVYNSRKITNISETNDAGEVSIDVVLEELNLN
ncbi:hypothetical protein Len3610_08870 [Lentibacillus sp. CBA3610]|nr:hypothetical protein Len3610_08870 [Lentibacillus sp. CBA3610]